MKTRGFVTLIIFTVGWVFAGATGRVARCPGAHDGSETWASFSVEQGHRFTAADLVTIWNYLESIGPDSEETASIKNNLLDRLVEQDPIPPGLGAKLLRFYRERSVSVIMRDYTLQHFAPYIVSMARRGDWQHDDDVLVMIGELQGALWNGEGVMGGSALLALESLAPLGDTVTVSDVGTYAVNLASDGNRPAAVRVTAIQAATRLGCKAVLRSARMAVRADQPVSLRLASVGCLGALGEMSDREELKRLQKEDSSGHIRLAARRALEQQSRGDAAAKPHFLPVDFKTTRKGEKE